MGKKVNGGRFLQRLSLEMLAQKQSQTMKRHKYDTKNKRQGDEALMKQYDVIIIGAGPGRYLFSPKWP